MTEWLEKWIISLIFAPVFLRSKKTFFSKAVALFFQKMSNVSFLKVSSSKFFRPKFSNVGQNRIFSYPSPDPADFFAIFFNYWPKSICFITPHLTELTFLANLFKHWPKWDIFMPLNWLTLLSGETFKEASGHRLKPIKSARIFKSLRLSRHYLTDPNTWLPFWFTIMWLKNYLGSYIRSYCGRYFSVSKNKILGQNIRSCSISQNCLIDLTTWLPLLNLLISFCCQGWDPVAIDKILWP